MTPRQGRALFAVASSVAFLAILGLGLGMTFFSDEWAFIESRSLGDPSSWLPPHNEHWSTLPILLYRVMVETIGIGSYVPYLAVVAALHMIVAALVYALIERRSGPWLGLAAGIVILFFGSGFENLFWGFQIGFVGSTALGLAALVVTDRGLSRGRAIAVAALLLASLATSGIGIVMSIAVGVEWVLDARSRRFVPILGVPAAVYLGWYLAIGRMGITTQRDPFTLGALTDVPGFVVEGFGNAARSVTGLPIEFAVVVGAIAIAWGVAHTRKGRLDPRAPAVLVAIVVQYAVTGLVRAQLFEGIVSYTRYTYVTGILFLLGISALIGRRTLPKQGTIRLLGVTAAAGWLVLTLTFNVVLLIGGRELFLQRADMTRALVTVALDPDPPDGAQLDRSLVLVPSAISLQRLAAAYGDPRADALVPWAVRPVPADTLAEARRRLIEGAPIPR